MDAYIQDLLNQVSLHQVGDKLDLEMHCDRCRTHLCDAEHGDTMNVLARVALEHVCTGR